MIKLEPSVTKCEFESNTNRIIVEPSINRIIVELISISIEQYFISPYQLVENVKEV